MRKVIKAKTALLAATSLLAATTAVAPVSASAYPSDLTEPTVIEASLKDGADAAAMADFDEQMAISHGWRWGLFGIAAGALAGALKLFGFRKTAAAVRDAAGGAAKTAGKAADGALKAVHKAAGAPIRWAGLILGFSLFVFFGIGFFDIEWAAGLVIGAAGAFGAVFGFGKIRRGMGGLISRLAGLNFMDNGN